MGWTGSSVRCTDLDMLIGACAVPEQSAVTIGRHFATHGDCESKRCAAVGLADSLIQDQDGSLEIIAFCQHVDIQYLVAV